MSRAHPAPADGHDPIGADEVEGGSTHCCIPKLLLVLAQMGHGDELAVDDPASVPAVQVDAQRLISEVEGCDVAMGALERTAFYERCRGAFAVVATTEDRPYGCFLLAKGVV